jgi:tetratricopeptide (TPR) repeat protein
MVVKNEEANLVRCLESVGDLVGEIVVVDTGSTDATREVARGFGARVIEAGWEDDFSLARNLALAAARGAWILVLDADEYLLEKDKASIRKLVGEALSGPEAGGGRAFLLQQKSSSDQGDAGMLVNIVRLFPNRPDVRYEFPIHEQVVTSLIRAGIAIWPTGIEIIHSGYADPQENLRKQRRNLAILRAQLTAGIRVSPLTHFLLGGARLDLGEFESALAAYTECERLAPPGSDIARGVRVRVVTCLVKLKRYAEASACLPADIERAGHPELLALSGESESALGRPEEARVWFERVLSCANQAFMPPCSLAAQKIRAVLWLGAYWKERGHAKMGVELYRCAVACRVRGEDFTLGRLRSLYRDYGVG